MWAGLKWLIKDSTALIACRVGREQRKEGRKKER